MKKLFAILTLIQVQVSLAGLPAYIVSHHDFIPYSGNSMQQKPIYEGRSSHLLILLSPCGVPINPPQDPVYPDVIISGNEIKVLTRLPVSAEKCTPPPPPSYFNYSELPALDSGNYHLSIYLIPGDVEYPPDDADLPNYLQNELNFEVFAVEIVDTLSIWNLTILMMALLMLGIVVFKKQDMKKTLT